LPSNTSCYSSLLTCLQSIDSKYREDFVNRALDEIENQELQHNSDVNNTSDIFDIAALNTQSPKKLKKKSKKKLKKKLKKKSKKSTPSKKNTNQIRSKNGSTQKIFAI